MSNPRRKAGNVISLQGRTDGVLKHDAAYFVLMSWMTMRRGSLSTRTMRRLLTSGICLAVATASHAAHWEVSYAGGVSSGSAAFSKDQDGYYSAEGPAVSGRIEARFTWVADCPGDEVEAPKVAYVRQFITVSAEGSVLGGVPTACGEISGIAAETLRVPIPLSTLECLVSETDGVLPMHPDAKGQFVVTATVVASGDQGATVRFRAEATPLAATITRDGGPSFRKGPHGPVSNATEDLATQSGDIWIDPHDYYVTDEFGEITAPYYRVQATFRRRLIGPWAKPFHRWQEGPNAYTDDIVDEWETIGPITWDIPEDEVRAMAKTGPITKTVRLTVTDRAGRGQTCEAVYRVRIHSQFEGWREVQTISSFYKTVPRFTVESPGYSQAGSTSACRWMPPDSPWARVPEGLSSRLASWNEAAERAANRAGNVELGRFINRLSPRPYNGNSVWAWKQEGSTIEGNRWDVDIELYRMYPELQEGLDRRLYEADEYGPQGYVGTASEIRVLPNFRYRWIGHFYPNNSRHLPRG